MQQNTKPIKQQIRLALSEQFDTRQTVVKNVNWIADVVKEKYPNLDKMDIKEALSEMNGWARVGPELEDQAQIAPSFFDEDK